MKLSTKNLLRGELGEKPFTKQPFGKPEKMKIVLLFEYFRKVLFLVCILFMLTFMGSRSILM